MEKGLIKVAMETRQVTFRAVLPNVQSAISISGNGDGARVKLDIPQEDLAQAITLALFQGQLLKVTIESVEEGYPLRSG